MEHLLLLSNISSWLMIFPIWMLMHHHRASGGPFSLSVTIGYAVFGLTLIANTALRILDESYQLVILGGVLTKISLTVTLTLVLFRLYKMEKKKNG